VTDETEPAPRLRPEDAPTGETSTNAELAAWWLRYWRQEQARNAYSEMAYSMTLMYTFLDRFEKYSGDDHYIHAVAAAMELEDLAKEELWAPGKCNDALLELEMLNTKVQKGLIREQ
jgi:hypothetical protein